MYIKECNIVCSFVWIELYSYTFGGEVIRLTKNKLVKHRSLIPNWQ